jgi:primosomal protein N' (replication factor Y)
MRAEVLVLVRTAERSVSRAPYVYAVPRALAGRLAPGQLVAVPFGARLAPGIVWALDDAEAVEADQATPHDGAPSEADAGTAPRRSIREVAAPLDPTPLLQPHQRALAEWLADRYNCTLAAAAQLMLPPGLLSNTRIVLRPADLTPSPSPSGEPDLTPNPSPMGRGESPDDDAGDAQVGGPPRDEGAVLGALRERGRLDERQVDATLGTQRARAALATLLATGAVTREPVVPEVWSGSRYEKRLRLVATDEALARWRETARATLNTLPQPGTATRARHGMRSRSQGERRAERLLRQLAVLDLLGRPVGQSQGSDAVSEWRLGEVQRLTRVTPAALAELEAAGLVAVEVVATRHDPLARRVIPRNRPLPLTSEQAAALAAILDGDAERTSPLAHPPPSPTGRGSPRTSPPTPLPVGEGREEEPGVVLLHGVTGSGKTEVYLQALAAILAAGRRGIVLVPEIALTPQAMVRFAGRFPGRVALLHSGLSDGERLDEWRRIRAGQVDVVVGSRSALFAPVERLGLIVVDEEHETAYKQEGRAPTYHARDVAVALGELTGARVVLGSATPSMEAYWAARQGAYRLVELMERAPAAGGAGRSPGLPPVTIVDLRVELRAGNTSILGRALQVALAETLAAGQQAVLFLNRRGTASSVICRECGYVALCGRCDVPMTYHASEAALICHYCGRHQPAPRVCPHCWGASIRYFGLGTERVEAAVRRLHPQARVLRWDRDTARTRQAHEDLLAAFAGRRADVLVGTQMIAKGLDLPGVTLVGVVSADVALYLPDFRASERAFQLLTQVAGRAGRGAVAGQVLIQTFNPDHFCIQAAARHDYHAFYAAEVSARARYGYPPFRQFVKFTYAHSDRYRAQVEAMALAERLERAIRTLGLEQTDLVGPAPAFMERLRGHYRWHLIARGPDLRALLHALAPEDLPRGWSVDVDPANTL